MGEARRKTPETMPTAELTASYADTLPAPFLVAGTRGDNRRANRTPSFVQHSDLGFSGPELGSCRNKHVVILVHGYNVDRREALRSAQGFFGQLQTALTADNLKLSDYRFVLFTWPGDTGPVWFNAAQEYAQHSGVGLYELLRFASVEKKAKSVTMITHSLGAHVGLRSASIQAERLIHGKAEHRFDTVILLAPAVENDVFHRPKLLESYHFPEAPFAMQQLHIVHSRGDHVLKRAYSASELDSALGYAGPQTMRPLKTMTQRVPLVLGENTTFAVELHDFSPNSSTVINPALHAHGHSDYWERQEQTDYYVNLLASRM